MDVAVATCCCRLAVAEDWARLAWAWLAVASTEAARACLSAEGMNPPEALSSRARLEHLAYLKSRTNQL